MATESGPILAICDRCGKDIPKDPDVSFMVLKATNIRLDRETYELHFLLCPDCREAFLTGWIFKKGVDTT